MHVVIYGAGDFGKKLYHFFEMLLVQVNYFVQSSEPTICRYENVEILSFEKYIELKRDDLIFIAINNPSIVREIKLKFIHLGHDANKIYDSRGFLEANSQSKKVPLGEKYCSLCERNFEKFIPSGMQDELFKRLGIIGGGYRENAVCPCCGSLDRYRWVFWLLQNKTGIFEEKCKVLHFAPEKQIRNRIELNTKCDYYPGDIQPSENIHQIDVTDIQFRDCFFDYIIINHVLEHVTQEQKAILEIMRVLKNSGKIIMSFPISTRSETFERDDIISPEERVKYYGQEDHVRLYGKDYKNRLEAYGLKVFTFSPKDYLSPSEIGKYGLIENDIVMICEKE